ncbi:uncharacterized protein LOC113564911 isoform X2 [Drosophila persimilis]|uniref:uncharacterized protein LOC113564911 isoform X2 n=1 Tax=Drosophila persimilis TaxID=7234 RepID=UPI000F0920E6|nr:uncharacterized protein LOC113564911 isoform X2 [Drosophila persimilis]
MWFNMTTLDMNMFAMADDVYNLMEIFDEASSFEGRIIKRIENVLVICDILVSVLVATIVGRYLFHSCFKKLHRSVKRTSYLPKFIAQIKQFNQEMGVQGSSVKSLDSIQPISQMKPIIQKMSVRGSKAKISKTDVEKDHCVQKPKNGQDQTVQERSSIEGIDDGDEVTMKASERENFSVKLMGTQEWAANYLATGGRTTP